MVWQQSYTLFVLLHTLLSVCCAVPKHFAYAIDLLLHLVNDYTGCKRLIPQLKCLCQF